MFKYVKVLEFIESIAILNVELIPFSL